MKKAISAIITLYKKIVKIRLFSILNNSKRNFKKTKLI